MSVKMYIVQGVSGSGKTRKAREMAKGRENFTIVSRDEIREHILSPYSLTEYFESGLDYATEAIVTEKEKLEIATALSSGRNVIVDSTHLKKKYMITVIRVAFDCGLTREDIILVPVDRPLSAKELHLSTLERDKGLSVISENVIERQLQQFASISKIPFEDILEDAATNYTPQRWFVPPFPVKKYEPIPGPTAIICDLDGTLSKRCVQKKNGQIYHRSFYSYDECDTDKPNFFIRELLQSFISRRTCETEKRKILFVTGRKGETPETTRTFIEEKCKIDREDYELFMRDESTDVCDGRDAPDDVVKYRIFNEYLREKYNIIGVIDDRKKVVALWEALGLNVLNAGSLNEEF